MRVIRPEQSADHAAIRRVNQLAFDGDVEAGIVERLRQDGLVVSSLVAEEDGAVVGHILFSDLPIRTDAGAIPAASLAPMAVHPDWQRRGIGSDMIRAGLDACRAAGKAAVIVLGYPDYYPRFGFSARLARGISSPWPDSGDAWMAIELEPGALKDVVGKVTYHEVFHS